MRPGASAEASLSRPFSDALLAVEAEECLAVVANIFGYHSVQISPWDETPDLLATAQTVSCHHLNIRPSGRLLGCFSGEMLELPLANESVSLAVLHHVHELVGGSHGLLSELHRIMRPDGVVILIGLSRWRRSPPPRMQAMSPSVLAERLRGFDLQTLMVRPLSARGSWFGSLVSSLTRRWIGAAWLGNLGESWLLVARKSRRGSPIFPLSRLPLQRVEGPVRASTSSFRKSLE